MRGRVVLVASVFKRPWSESDFDRPDLLVNESRFTEEVDDVESSLLMSAAISRAGHRVEAWLRWVRANLVAHAVVVVYALERGLHGSESQDGSGDLSEPSAS